MVPPPLTDIRTSPFGPHYCPSPLICFALTLSSLPAGNFMPFGYPVNVVLYERLLLCAFTPDLSDLDRKNLGGELPPGFGPIAFRGHRVMKLCVCSGAGCTSVCARRFFDDRRTALCLLRQADLFEIFEISDLSQSKPVRGGVCPMCP